MRSLKLAAILLLFTSSAWADSQVRIVRLSLVDGPVQLDRATGEGFERAIMNMPIAQGMQLWTRDDSRAEVEFEDGNTVRLAPGTKIEFSQLQLRNDGSRSTLIRIDSGRAYFDYSHKSGEDFRIQIGNQEVALRDSVRFRADIADGKAELAVLSGSLYAGGEKVKKNNTALLDVTSGTFQLARGVTPVLDDDWDDYRADYHDKYAKSAYKGSSYYGRSDLNYYGGWYSTNIGDCWRPYGFDASWSPYSAGAWAYYPSYGYSFVSAYPWGWQPFHYGAWNYASGFGYCWTPGSRFYGYGYTPVIHPPQNWVPVRPPVVPRSPLVTGGPGTHPWHRGPGLIPVGDIDTANWQPRHRQGGPAWTPGRWPHRGDQPPTVATGRASGATGSTATAAVVNPNAASSALPREKGRIVNPDGDPNAMREMQRQHQREWHNEMRQQQQTMQRTEMQRLDRSGSGGFNRGSANEGGFDRGAARHGGFDRGGGGAAASSNGGSAPRMSAPAPAPQMSAPAPMHSAPSAPSHVDVKTGNVPK